MDLEDLNEVVQHGRAFRSGDVVLLRSRLPISREAHERFREMMADLEAETGVRFVLLSHDIEVVEAQ